MEKDQLLQLLDEIQQEKCETNILEIKKAHTEAPNKLYDTMSSFSNQDSGGVIVFGIDERNNFEEVGVYDTQDLIRKISEKGQLMTPCVRPIITEVSKGNKSFVSAEIPSLPYYLRPCFYSRPGRIKGSYIRSGNQDLPMTEYEIYSYESYRKREYAERDTFENSIRTKWNENDVNEFIKLSTFQRPNFAMLDRDTILELLFLKQEDQPTLLSILLFGLYPQSLFPKLSVAVSAIPGEHIGDLSPEGERFLSTARFEGTILEILEQTMYYLQNTLHSSIAFDSATGKRQDILEIPPVVLREALLNALIHRDYSRYTREISISVNIFSDRIEIQNPGELYGSSNIERLGEDHFDSRNPQLVHAMEVLHQSENRYSGIPTIRTLLKEKGLPEPKFTSHRGSFTITIFRYSAQISTNRSVTLKSLTAQEIQILEFLKESRSRKEIAAFMNRKNPTEAIRIFIKPLMENGLISLSIPEDFSSRKQRFYLSKTGKDILNSQE